MPKFTVDIGTWTSGRCVEVEAIDPRQAHRIAESLINDQNDEPSAIVVQIKDWNGNCVYDYMSGFIVSVSSKN